ncbi:aminotransferase class I/II-fold pyridoxal phosphate-dependent enzyme [Nonomuraea sp. NPDC050790]|uniref:aminotransferase class I/II-fold pyridoxal phosphate-dependent enzyme n=1 Tax=Nonomuraea sp. NPDC050790 TaxID=3364371 RepID=UPI0037B4E17F
MTSSGAVDKWGFETFAQTLEEGSGLIGEPAVVDGITGPSITQNGRTLTNLASINLLNLHQRADLRQCFAEGAHRYGLTTGGSRMTQGICRAHLELEHEVSQVTGKERAISFATGLLANLGFVHAMSQDIDLGAGVRMNNSDSVFVLDRESHWSLWKAVEGLGYGKRVFFFRHNDPDHLDRVLTRVRGNKVVVVMESVYSADGTMGPIPALLDLCEKHNAISFVDDANGFMIYGPAHRPFATEYQHIRDRADFVMMSFSKAVGLEGGAISGPSAAVRSFELLSGTSMFTAAMQPPTAVTAREIIRRLRDEPGIVDSYLAKVTAFRQRLADIGCETGDTNTYIVSVPVNDDDVAVGLRQSFLDHGYLVPVFVYPAVKRNRALLRLIISDGHTEEQLNGFLSTLSALKDRFAF